jgi:hypothetical protein
LEVHYSHAAELAARDLPEHVLTMQASGLARIEIVGGRTARSHVIAAGGFCLAPAGPTDLVRWNALRTLFVIALAPRWMDALAGENQRSQVALRGAVGVRDPHIEWLAYGPSLPWRFSFLAASSGEDTCCATRERCPPSPGPLPPARNVSSTPLFGDVPQIADDGSP